ncbi:hypothetical protein CUZ96_1486 [Enterococcus lactis]|nr:hypothetical protein [Enterococcus lactis]
MYVWAMPTGQDVIAIIFFIFLPPFFLHLQYIKTVSFY